MSTLPDFDELWDYQHPDQTEMAFRQLLPRAEQSEEDRSYHLQLLTQIARTQGLQRQFSPANETLDMVEAQIARAPVRPHIRYLLERGRVLRSSGHPDQASPFFQQAWELANSSHGEDFYVVDAAHMLAMVAPSEDQMAWNLKAIQCAEASTDERARGWSGLLYNNLGWVYHGKGDYERALDLFQKALQFRLTEGKAREARIARWCVDRTLHSLQRTAEALGLQQDVLVEWEKSREQEIGYVSEEVGECLLALGRTSESCSCFARAYTLLAVIRGSLLNMMIDYND